MGRLEQSVSTLNLDKIFDPRHVAVFGAGNTPASVGYTVLRNLIGSGFLGAVFPVSSNQESIRGVRAYKDVASLPQVPDLAVICTPPATVPPLIRDLGEAGTRGIVVISSGFREVGQAGGWLEREILEEKRNFDGMRIVGPNCLGIIVPGIHLNASFAAAMPKNGHIGFISQSGALCTSVLDWALDEGIGFSYFVSIGNMLDVSVGDLIDYLGAATQTQSIILYIESITEVREFMSAARAFSRTKPIVAFKAGRFAQSAQAAASHTGAMAGVDAVYEAAFQRAGIERIFQIDEMFDCAEILARQQPPKGARVAILTNAGGPGVMTTDALIDRAGILAELSADTIARLNEVLPPFWSHGNPVDLLGDALPDRYSRALEILLKEKEVDAVLVILTPQAMTDPTGTAHAIARTAAKGHKPILAAWMGGNSVHEGIHVLNAANIPTYTTPEKAVRAFMHLVSYARKLSVLHETPREVPMAFQVERHGLRSVFANALSEGNDILSEQDSKAFLEAYGIPTTKPFLARTAAEAVEAGRRIGYPVVMKIHSPQITHKTDVEGVILSLAGDDVVREAFDRMTNSAAQQRPDANIVGVTMQKMIAYPNSFELILGTKKDPVFGAVIMVGMGGVAADLFRDRALALPPLNASLARRALESLTSWPLLQGYRGRPGVEIGRLVEIVIRFSYLVAEYPEIKEMDVNPLLCTREAVIALDARIVVDRDVVGRGVRPYAHLAIRPYPDEFVTERKLKDGNPVVLRPIRPEDEPMWHDLLSSCSTESLRFRFNYLFKRTTHEMASRYCFIDYDREMGIVAEVEEHGARKLIGVGRLVADANHEIAEYAVIVVDRWHGHGLGGLLTDYCLEIARHWGVKRVVAETTRDNVRMLATFRDRGFAMDHEQEEDVVLVSREVGVGSGGEGIRD
jgi:acetyltransferase